MPPTLNLLAPSAIEQLRREIADAGGVEIFAVLSKEAGSERYNLVKVVARGSTTEVPALISRARIGDMTVHNHPSGELRPSGADMAVASLFGEEGVGSMIVDNQVASCHVVVEPAEVTPTVAVSEDEIRAIFEPGGLLSRKLKGFEAREGQLEMALEVTRAFNRGEVLAVEAGTGTGKSLAYLIPSMLWAKSNKARIAIATKTIALQEQLIHKDIPIVQRIIEDPPKAALVKGRSNYVCLRKVKDLEDHQLSLFPEEESALKQEIRALMDWSEKTGKGDRADLPFLPSHDAWEAVRSDADMCLGVKCPHFQQAPFYQSRREALDSNIMVLNQSLLFADLALRRGSGNYKSSVVIPAYSQVVLDEAHSIEDIATDYFSETVSSFGMRMTLLKLFSQGRLHRGTLVRIVALIAKEMPEFNTRLQLELLPEYGAIQEQLTQEIHALAEAMHQRFNDENRKQQVVWLKDDMLSNSDLDEIRNYARELYNSLVKLIQVANKIRDGINDPPESLQEKLVGARLELDARLSRLEDMKSPLKNFAMPRADANVHWLELKQNRQFRDFDYRISPLDVSALLRESLFEPFQSVVMASATLDLKDDFAFFTKRLGLHELTSKPLKFRAVVSPFNPAEQGRLYLARLNCDPDRHGFADELTDLILRTVFSGYPGGTLVLFTSYSLLNQVAKLLSDPLAENGFEMLVQGREQRSVLVERLKQNQGVLLGTDSFWEGIDLPGLALTKVVISRLPFRQIGDPIFEARCQAIERAGLSSFQELSLPLALLKFKQGVGRLIRTRSDKGVLIVADNRIRTKSYGRRFLMLGGNFPAWEIEAGQIQHELWRIREEI